MVFACVYIHAKDTESVAPTQNHRRPSSLVVAPLTSHVAARSRDDMTSLVVVLTTLLVVGVVIGQCHGGWHACSGCKNGGELLLPSALFGLCRCVCPPSYIGEVCQYRHQGKRSGVTRSDMTRFDATRSDVTRSDVTRRAAAAAAAVAAVAANDPLLVLVRVITR